MYIKGKDENRLFERQYISIRKNEIYGKCKDRFFDIDFCCYKQDIFDIWNVVLDYKMLGFYFWF